MSPAKLHIPVGAGSLIETSIQAAAILIYWMYPDLIIKEAWKKIIQLKMLDEPPDYQSFRRAVRKLEESGVISQSKRSIDLSVLGYESRFYIGVEVDPHELKENGGQVGLAKKIKEIAEKRADKFIIRDIVILFGSIEYDLYVDCIVFDEAAFLDFVIGDLRTLKGVTKSHTMKLGWSLSSDEHSP